MAGLGNTFLVLLVTLHTVARAEIIKPYGEWLCNYCSMGEIELYLDFSGNNRIC